MSTVTTGGIGNPFLSLIEDFYAVLQVLAAIFLPLVVIFLIVLLLIPMGIYFWLRSSVGERHSPAMSQRRRFVR